jgi:glycosyltransferase involved in cell wall biosynthesis
MVNGSESSPLISIITACLNADEFIEETIQSVLGQSYPKVEYIIIDGGSTDSTMEIVDRYATRLSYWHSRLDRGLAHAFNLGLSHAQGDWLLFLNADDYLFDSGVIANMVPHLNRHPEADVVFGQVAWAGRHKEVSKGSLITRGQPWRWSTFRFVCTIPHQAAFTPRRYFERFGGFKENLRIAMDYELFLRRGPDLQAIFVPQLISVMRLGGVSSNIMAALKEWRTVQLFYQVSPNWLIWGNYLCRAIWNIRKPELIKKVKHMPNMAQEPAVRPKP